MHTLPSSPSPNLCGIATQLKWERWCLGGCVHICKALFNISLHLKLANLIFPQKKSFGFQGIAVSIHAKRKSGCCENQKPLHNRRSYVPAMLP